MNDKKPYREYTEEFKLQTLDLLEHSGKSTSQIERELGITPGLVRKWRSRYQITTLEGVGSKLGSSDIEAVKAEIRRLQRELAHAEEEREILKKVVNIFSRKNG